MAAGSRGRARAAGRLQGVLPVAVALGGLLAVLAVPAVVSRAIPPFSSGGSFSGDGPRRAQAPAASLRQALGWAKELAARRATLIRVRLQLQRGRALVALSSADGLLARRYPLRGPVPRRSATLTVLPSGRVLGGQGLRWAAADGIPRRLDPVGRLVPAGLSSGKGRGRWTSPG